MKNGYRDLTQITFSGVGKEGESKILSCAVQCYFRGEKLIFNSDVASIENTFIGNTSVPLENSNPDRLEWPTAQPFETVSLEVKFKKTGEFKVNVLGRGRQISRIEI